MSTFVLVHGSWHDVDKDLTDIVLLGHSFGGTIIAKVAEVISDHTRRLIFFAAPVLNDGERLIDTFPPSYQTLFDLIANESDDHTVIYRLRFGEKRFSTMLTST
jgi:pimeloyl-ACP methyl ester carboxylesterase